MDALEKDSPAARVAAMQASFDTVANTCRQLRHDRAVLMATARRLLRAIDRNPEKAVADMQDETGRPDRLLRDAVDVIEKRLSGD